MAEISNQRETGIKLRRDIDADGEPVRRNTKLGSNAPAQKRPFHADFAGVQVAFKFGRFLRIKARGAAMDGDVPAGGGQREGDGAPDAPAGAGDEGNTGRLLAGPWPWFRGGG